MILQDIQISQYLIREGGFTRDYDFLGLRLMGGRREEPEPTVEVEGWNIQVLKGEVCIKSDDNTKPSMS